MVQLFFCAYLEANFLKRITSFLACLIFLQTLLVTSSCDFRNSGTILSLKRTASRSRDSAIYDVNSPVSGSIT